MRTAVVIALLRAAIMKVIIILFTLSGVILCVLGAQKQYYYDDYASNPATSYGYQNYGSASQYMNVAYPQHHRQQQQVHHSSAVPYTTHNVYQNGNHNYDLVYHHRVHHIHDTPFHFHKHGHAHFYPPIAVVGG